MKKKRITLTVVQCYAATNDKSIHAGHVWHKRCRAIHEDWDRIDSRRWLEYYWCEGYEGD